jgi:indolepyruvate ferredoxin oxidoreductase beta subunit
MAAVRNVFFVGVGGQGIVLASELLAKACMAAGHDVKQSEVHGMAQRGGSVTSHVRFGPRVFSPTIAVGEADFMVAFELLEGLRGLEYLAPDGVPLVNTQRLDPITVTSGTTRYPADVDAQLRQRCPQVVLVDGLGLAQRAGNARAVNIALLGALSARLDIDPGTWEEAIRNRVPPKTFAANWAAFAAGRQV